MGVSRQRPDHADIDEDDQERPHRVVVEPGEHRDGTDQRGENADVPEWLQVFAEHQPVTANANAIRALTLGGPTAEWVVKALAWGIEIFMVFVVTPVQEGGLSLRCLRPNTCSVSVGPQRRAALG
jgi:hypothetical protein